MENKTQSNNSRLVLAWVLIAAGSFWILKKLGLYFGFSQIFLHEVFLPFRNVFDGLFHFIFSWQMVLIIVGLILLAGKRSAGTVLIVIGGIFMLPKILFLPGFTISMFLPLVLIALGIAIVVRKI